MNILVIGGNRFVGKRLVNMLIGYHNVTVLNRSGTGPIKSKKIRSDRDKWDWDNLDKFDCIVDMCLFNPNQFNKIKNLIPKQTKYVFISSGAVEYINMFGDYAQNKKAIEDELESSKLNYTIVRPSYIDGINNHHQRIEYYIRSLLSYQEVDINGDRGNYPINIVDADDVALCIKQIVEMEFDITMRKIYNVCGDQSMTIDQIIEMIKQKLNIKSHTSYNSAVAPFFKGSFEMDNKLTKQDLDIEFKNIETITDLLIEDVVNNEH